MGGGSGITLKSNDYGEVTIILKKENGIWEISNVDKTYAGIESFNAEGYNSGVSNLKGNLLTFEDNKAYDIPDGDSIDEWVKEEIVNAYRLNSVEDINGIDLESTTIELLFHIRLEDQLWGGFTSGNIKDIDTFEVDKELYDCFINLKKTDGSKDLIDVYDKIIMENVLETPYYKKTNPEEFNSMWNCIFDSYISDDEIELYKKDYPESELSNDEIAEMIMEDRYEYIKDNYLT